MHCENCISRYIFFINPRKWSTVMKIIKKSTLNCKTLSTGNIKIQSIQVVCEPSRDACDCTGNSPCTVS